jgi:excisionase family DNA binding protein
MKVAEKPVYSMVQGQLSASRAGGQRRFKRVDLEQWIEKLNAPRRRGARIRDVLL